MAEKTAAVCSRAHKEIIVPLQQRQLYIEHKDGTGRNFVTEADQACEAFLKKELKKLLPSAGFIAEESFDGKVQSELNWIIDPIDGTTNFMHGSPPYCISVALAEGEDLLVGVVHELSSGECFHAEKGQGAFLNKKRIRVSQTATLADSLLGTGFPYDHGGRFQKWMEIFTALLEKTQGIRRPGAAAVDMAYVACGRYDGFFEYNLHAWDVAAGALLISEAGGKTTGFSSDDFLFSGRLACSNGKIHDELLSFLKDFDLMQV